MQLENENFNWQNGRQITSIFSKIKITLFKTFKEIFYLRNKKKHNSELHIYLENLVNDKKINIIGGGCAALSLARLIRKLPNYKSNLFIGNKNKS